MFHLCVPVSVLNRGSRKFIKHSSCPVILHLFFQNRGDFIIIDSRKKCERRKQMKNQLLSGGKILEDLWFVF